jgi:hypothetical protein
MFDFEQVDFVPRFLRGEMLYRMVPVDGPTRIASYNAERRDAWAQELALSPDQKTELVRYAEWNALPENRDYLYQYFLDNCSTRVRDLLDRVLGGQLSRAFASLPAETTFRFETRRMTQVDAAAAAGIDLLLGSPTDDPISVWEQMFLPSVLRETLRDVSITLEDGTTRPLVASETYFAVEGAPPEPESRPRWWPVYLLVGLAVGGLLLLHEGPGAAPGATRIGLTAFATVWSGLTGLVGTLLVLLLFTDHTFAHANHNLMLFPPLLLVMAVLWPMSLRQRRAARLASLFAWAIAALSIVTMLIAALPGPGQGNEGFLALALPAHLAAAFVLHRRARRAGVP